MDIQEADLTLKAAGLVLTIINSVGVVIVWIGNKNRATKDAIDRVETVSRAQHQEQETRLIRLETDMRHALTRSDLEQMLSPLYELVRKNESNTAGIRAELTQLANEQRDFRNMILERGINK